MLLGVDISTYLEELEHGAVFLDGDKRIDPLDGLRKNGVGCVRIRLWNDPYDGDGKPYLAGGCDLDNFMRLAELAEKKGFSVMLDIHYSDFWADPGKQFLPKAWRGLGAEELVTEVREYTLGVLTAIKERGLDVAMIQVGNEITNGMLWPHGRLTEAENGRSGYGYFCRLLNAGFGACREIFPEARLIIHTEKSGDKALYDEFYTNMLGHGVDFDIIGVSYYPYWHGTPEDFFENMRMCRKFGKPVMIVETGYGFTCAGYYSENGTETRMAVGEELSSASGIADRYPLTLAGQAAFIRDLLSSSEKNGIAGVFYWEPLWLRGDGIRWASGNGLEYIGEAGKSTENEWANQCLFDYDGKKLPAFDEFRLKRG